MTGPRRFFGLLCAHEWKIIEQAALIRITNGYGDHEEAGRIYVLLCTHCGNVKSRSVRL